jgi:DNA-binding MarR family transcriptional regulator
VTPGRGATAGVVDAGERDAMLRARVWEQICRHLDGVAIGSTMAALHEAGALRALAAARRSTVDELAERLGANAGYLHVAVRLLADQGWVERSVSHEGGDAVAEVTSAGRAAFGLAAAFAPVQQALSLGRRMDQALFGAGDAAHAAARRSLAALRDLLGAEWGLDRRAVPVGVRMQILQQLDGHLVTPIAAVLARRGILEHGMQDELRIDELGGCRDALALAFEILAAQGWATVAGDSVRLTATGAIAAAWARQYWYGASYLATFERVPRLLFAGSPPAAHASAAGDERHVDRELDIAFSGAVFDARCREPFLAVALPAFDAAPLERQPATVVDTGCGDGSLLLALYEAVRERTLRGRQLERRPLVMVGIEPSAVARRSTAARMAAAGVPNVVLAGDVGDPAGIERALRRAGIDPLDALHVSKSVIHNRAFRGGSGSPEGPAQAPASAGESQARAPAAAAESRAQALAPAESSAPDANGGPRRSEAVANRGRARSEAAFAAPDGSRIAPAALVADLVEHLRGWRRLAARHGLLVIEAHAGRPAVTARLLGRGIGTLLDATHGYSNQYPVEPEVFLDAARAAGLRAAVHTELGSPARGSGVLTIDHFVEAPAP